VNSRTQASTQHGKMHVCAKVCWHVQTLTQPALHALQIFTPNSHIHANAHTCVRAHTCLGRFRIHDNARGVFLAALRAHRDSRADGALALLATAPKAKINRNSCLCLLAAPECSAPRWSVIVDRVRLSVAPGSRSVSTCAKGWSAPGSDFLRAPLTIHTRHKVPGASCSCPPPLICLNWRYDPSVRIDTSSARGSFVHRRSSQRLPGARAEGNATNTTRRYE
jgi:hypothetical protein